MLTLNGLVAADSVLVPLQCEFLALEGLSQLVRTIERVTARFNLLQIEGIVLTMYDVRNKLSSLVEDDVRGFFGDKVYETIIPRNVKSIRGTIARQAGLAIRPCLCGCTGICSPCRRDVATPYQELNEIQNQLQRVIFP